MVMLEKYCLSHVACGTHCTLKISTKILMVTSVCSFEGDPPHLEAVR